MFNLLRVAFRSSFTSLPKTFARKQLFLPMLFTFTSNKTSCSNHPCQNKQSPCNIKHQCSNQTHPCKNQQHKCSKHHEHNKQAQEGRCKDVHEHSHGEGCSHNHRHEQHQHGPNCNHSQQKEQVKLQKKHLTFKEQTHQLNGNSLTTLVSDNSISVQNIKGPRSQKGIYAIQFTCGPCNHRMIRTFTKHSYEKGVVLIKCQNCQKVHLIADNLGWFQDEKTNIEKIAEEKGISIKKGPSEKEIESFLDQIFQKSK